MHERYPDPVRTLNVMHDLDGCFHLFDRSWWTAAVKLDYLDPAKHPYRAADKWDFHEDYGVDLDGFLRICGEAANRGLLWCGGVIPGGIAAWQNIAADGHVIHVKTDRQFGVHPVASEVGTFYWLHGHDLPYESVTFTKDKTAGPDVDMALEDRLDNYDALDAAGVLTYLIDRPWNQDPGDARRRIYSLDEWTTRVRAYAAVPVPEPV